MCGTKAYADEHNYDEYKGAGVQWTPLRSRSTDRGDSRDSKICRRADARQIFLTQQSSKFAEKTCILFLCEHALNLYQSAFFPVAVFRANVPIYSDSFFADIYRSLRTSVDAAIAVYTVTSEFRDSARY